MLVGILHQGFSAYVARSSANVQKEWEKVAGRFEEIVFRQPLDQMVHIAAAALNVNTRALPQETLTTCQRSMRETLPLGWYGASTPVIQQESAPGIYPLHPTAFPVLTHLFSRYGQNERSLFSFLFSTDRFGLQDFASTHTDPKLFYRIHHLYHYIKANLGYRLVDEPGSRWALLESLVDSY